MKNFRLTHWTKDDDVIHGIKRQGEERRKQLLNNHQTLSVMFGTENRKNNILFRAVEPTKSKRTSQKTTLLY